MIATAGVSRAMLRAVAPLVWRSARRIAVKLEGFAATEAGSALDMLKAAELAEDPLLRRLFFRHAMDEARHAQLFRAAARALATDSGPAGYQLIHARRQNLFASLPLTRFIAFVHLAEQRGELQFQVLRRHFEDVPELERLFARIAREERFHVSYSGRWLEARRRAGFGAEVRAALLAVRARAAWQAWRRAGRALGDLTSRALLSVIYLVALPLFVLLSRALDAPARGWQRRPGLPADLDAARRLF
ncbi:MAG: ferritin-like domain-containing protein [Myxococcaceae bacterium]|nr:ferritin-like domain-containing protein [Myxococcaceae bacterium]